MNTDMLSTSIAFLVFGLLAQFTSEHYLKKVVISLNTFQIFKLDPIVTVRIVKIFAKGILLISVLGIVDYLFGWNSYN